MFTNFPQVDRFTRKELLASGFTLLLLPHNYRLVNHKPKLQHVLSLEQRIAALERQLSSLKPSEQAQPNYLTVDAQGRVSANFSGIINAQGVVIPSAFGGAPLPPNRISWQRASDRAFIADIFASTTVAGSTSEGLLLRAFAHAAAEFSDVEMQAIDDTGQQQAQLFVQQNNRGNGLAQATAGSKIATIIDASGSSAFLQLLSTQKLRSAFGTGSVNFTTGNQTTAAVTIPHGLGTTPQAVLAFFNLQGITAATFTLQTSQAPDATNIYLYGQTSSAPGGNFSEPFWWVALG